MPTAAEPAHTDGIAASTSILPAGEGPEEGEGVFLAEADPGLTTLEKETTHPPSETTLHPATHRASTARATTAQAPVTSHSHRAVQPDLHETSRPVGSGHPDPHTPSTEDRGPSATEGAAEEGVATEFPAGEGSGEQVSADRSLLCLGHWVAPWCLVERSALGRGAQVGHLAH